MKPEVTYPDPEVLLVPVVADLLDELGSDATCGVGVPPGWVASDEVAHVEVAWDGTPEVAWPLVAWPTVRIVVHGFDPSPTKALALALMGKLAATTALSAKPLTGVLPTPDPDDPEAVLAAFTVRVTTRSESIPTFGS